MSAVKCVVLDFTVHVVVCPDEQQFPIEPIPMEGDGEGDGGGSGGQGGGT